MAVSLFLYGLVVLALLVAELKEDRRAQYFFKPLAALGFILIAIYVGALESQYGRVILAGLAACAFGDVFLLSRKSEKLFMAGMGSFALGHFAYLVAFLTRQADAMSNLLVILSTLLPVIAGAVFYLWLRPHLSKPMRLAVMIYASIITLMVVRSFGVPLSGVMLYAPIAAIMFAVSDMFVARDRFVKLSPKNALAITPLYFGAQALFALSTSI